MKRFFLLFVFLTVLPLLSSAQTASLVYSNAWSFNEGYARVEKNGKCGFIDQTGKLVIPCVYESVTDFHEGLALVSKKSGENYRFFYINVKGEEVLSMSEYSSFSHFQEGFTYAKKDGKYGFIDKNGKEITAFKYDSAESFKNGLARVKKDGFWGYIDVTGKEVTPIIYTEAHALTEGGLAFVERNNKKGYINRYGKEIIPCKYDWADEKNGIAAVGFRSVKSRTVVGSDGVATTTVSVSSEKDQCWLIDSTGRVLAHFSNGDYLLPPSEGLVAIRSGEEWGYADISGRMVIPFKYKRTESFDNGLGIVFKGAKGRGFIDRTGKEVIPCIYDYVHKFRDGIAAVEKDGKWGFIDKNGAEIAPCIYYLRDPFTISEGMARVKTDKNGKYGFVNSTGLVIPCTYDLAEDFHEGFSMVRENGKYGFIDKTGKVVIPCIYDYAYHFHEGFALVERNGKYGFIDKTGKVITR